jgi:hypothetical protein
VDLEQTKLTVGTLLHPDPERWTVRAPAGRVFTMSGGSPKEEPRTESASSALMKDRALTARSSRSRTRRDGWITISWPFR